MTHTPRTRRPGARTATSLALAATMLTTAGVAAQSPTATPTPGATTAPTTTDRSGRDGRGGTSDRRGPGRDASARHGVGEGSRDSRGSRSARSSTITVTSNDGTSLALETADGWSRTIDTTGVALTRDGTTIAITDVLVGERVRVVQTRNADGSYTVTGIEVQPARASGTIGTVSADGFSIVVGSDGTTTNVTVDAETAWSAPGSSSVTIADATTGRSVTVEGALQADGSILASRVRLG